MTVASSQLDLSGYLNLLVGGLLNTLEVFAGALVLATAIGLLLGSLRLSRWRGVRYVSAALVEIFRGTSVIIQVFWLYYALPLVTPIHLTPVVAAWIAIGLTEGAYIAEVVRGAFSSVPRSQYEGSIALNLSSWTRWRRVVLPQAIPVMLPSYANHVVSTLKETAVVSLITIQDLTFVAEAVRNRTSASGLVFVVLALIYLGLALILTGVLRGLESRVRVGPPIRRRGFRLQAIKDVAAGG
jgi:polar amino acid transport system permease protein